MATIDDRIVQMQFNNKQFESAATQSMSTLDKLKEKLNFSKNDLGGIEETTTMLDRMKAKMRFGKNDLGDVDGANGAIRSMGSAVEDVRAKFSVMGAVGFTVIQDLTRSVIGFVNRTVSKITDPVFSGGMDRALKIEQARFQFKGLGQDVEASMDSALKAVKGTAYGLDAAAAVASQFGATGMKAGDEMTHALRGVAGMAAMTGRSYEEIGNIFTTVAGEGKLTTVRLQQFATRGVNAAAKLAEQMGKTEAEVRKMVTEGEIDFKTFAGAMADAFGEHATKANETYTGSVANMRAALSRIGASIQAPKMEAQRKIFNALTDTIDQTSDALAPLIEIWEKFLDVSSKRTVKFLEGLDARTILNPIVGSLVAIHKILMQILKPIRRAFSDVFTPTSVNQIAYMLTYVRIFFEEIKIGSETMRNLRRTFRGFFAVISIGMQIFKGLIGFLWEWISVIFSGSGALLEFTGNIGDWIVALDKSLKEGNKVNEFFDNLTIKIKNAISFLQRITERVKNFFRGFAEGVSENISTDALEKFKGLFGGLIGDGIEFTSAWERVKHVFSEIGKVLKPIGKGIGAGIGRIITALAETLGGTEMTNVLKMIQTGGLVAGIVMLRKLMKDGLSFKFGLLGMGDDDEGPGFFGKIKESITNSLEPVTSTLESMQNRLNTESLMKIAIIIGVLAASLVVLSMIKPEKLLKAVVAMAALSGVFFVMVKRLTGLVEELKASAVGKLLVVSAVLTLIAGALTLLLIPVFILSRMSLAELTKGLGGVALMLVMLVKTINKLSKDTKKIEEVAKALIMISIALGILTYTVKTLGGMDWKELGLGLGALALLLIMLVKTMDKFSANTQDSTRAAISLVLMAGAVRILASSIKLLGDMKFWDLVQGVAATAIAMKILTSAVNSLPADTFLKSLAIVVLAGAMVILSKALKTMGDMGIWDILQSILLLAASLAILAGAMYLMTFGIAGIPGILAAAVALMILAPALVIIGKMKFKEIVKAMVAIAGAFIILSIGMAAMTFGLLGVPAIMAAAKALAILTPVLVILGKMKMSEIGKALLVIAGAFTILGVAGLLLAPIVLPILGLSAALLMVGAAMMMAGVAALTFSMAFASFVAVGSVGVGVLTTLLEGLINLIPLLGEKVGQGIVNLFTVLVAAGPTIQAAFFTALSGLLDAIIELTPKIGEAIRAILDLMIRIFGEFVPDFIQLGYTLLIGLLNKFGENIGELAEAATTALVNLAQAIEDNIGTILQAGADILVALIDGFSDAITDNTERMGRATAKFHKALGGSLKSGATGYFKELFGIGEDMGDATIHGVEVSTQTRSPSKKMEELGENQAEGLIAGMKKRQKDVGESAKKMGKEAIKRITDEMNGNGTGGIGKNINLSPKITPVLDLTELTKDAKGIDSLMGGRSIIADASFGKASGLEAMVDSTRGGSVVDSDTKSVTIEYNQTNNSPKSLDASEIYRNTKSQLSMMKEELKI